ncbi:MAG: ral nucleoside transport system permease protein [Thermoleophilaceae bacterium]|jgi:simple sugar transport system permease protein|nr:ral nucleoside transport system permease protein [Thermoleophilaceae bacterium]MEA2402300.1 ral nucleoside transport system permease protein [Thermoleophilaceae bacterium]
MNDGTVIQFMVIAIGAGTPLVYAAVGEILAERSGVMNLGVEGMMLTGAVMAYWVTAVTGSTGLGLLAGAVAGAAMASLHAFLSITLRSNQIVSGIALVILGTGIAAFLGSAGPKLVDRASGGTFEPLLSSGLADLPIVGPLIFGHDVLVYGSWLVVGLTSWYLFHSRPGLHLRAVGEDPATADASGLPVARTRYIHVLLGGAGAGVAGTYVSLALFGSWSEDLSNGTGWIAIALVIFSAWRPVRALIAAYVFGALTSLGFNLQLIEVPVPLDLLAVLPFVMTLIALMVVSNLPSARRLGAPGALGEPYWREQR